MGVAVGVGVIVGIGLSVRRLVAVRATTVVLLVGVVERVPMIKHGGSRTLSMHVGTLLSRAWLLVLALHASALEVDHDQRVDKGSHGRPERRVDTR